MIKDESIAKNSDICREIATTMTDGYADRISFFSRRLPAKHDTRHTSRLCASSGPSGKRMENKP